MFQLVKKKMTRHTNSATAPKVRVLWNKRMSLWIMAVIYVPTLLAAWGLVRRLPTQVLQTLTDVFWILLVVAAGAWTVSGALLVFPRARASVPIDVARVVIMVSVVLAFIVGWSATPLAIGHHLLRSPTFFAAGLLMIAPRWLLEDWTFEPSPIRQLNQLSHLYKHHQKLS